MASPSPSAPPATASPGAGPAITTRGLSKRYGQVNAVDGLSVEIPSGVVAGFVGPNGSGKTTTIRMLLGQVRPSGGSAEILGTSILHARAVLPRVGALIESPTFYPGLSGRDNLRVLATLGCISHRRVDELLEQVGLAGRGGDRVRGYSLGMRQRLGVAAALLPDPDLLILDEPANGLDPEGILEMRTLMRRLREAGTTIFISSHLLGELEQIADWLVAIRSGTLMYAGPTQEMLTATGAVLLVAPEKVEQLDTVLRVATALGLQAEVRDQEVHVHAGRDRAAELNRACQQAGVTLIQIQLQQASLEESFLAMVEGGS